MDDRRTLLLLLALIAGCQSTKTGPSLSALPTPKTAMPEAGNSTITRAVSTTPDSKKKEPLKPSTWIAVAEFRSQLAENPELSFGEAEQIRSNVRQAYYEALKLDPKCSAAFIGLAKSYVAVEDAPQAFAMYDKALALMPNEPTLWMEKGLTYARFKEFDKAVDAMQHAAKLDPDNRMYRKTIGMTLARAGRMDDAFAALRTCMKEEEVHFTLARMCQHLGQPDVAREYLTLSLKARPTYGPAHEMIAELNSPAVQTVSHEQPGQ